MVVSNTPERVTTNFYFCLSMETDSLSETFEVFHFIFGRWTISQQSELLRSTSKVIRLSEALIIIERIVSTVRQTKKKLYPF